MLVSTEVQFNIIRFAQGYGKDSFELVRALWDVQINEFERIKEFGIRINKDLDRFIVIYKGESRNVKHPIIYLMDNIIK
jgi:hypothetical protein